MKKHIWGPAIAGAILIGAALGWLNKKQAKEKGVTE